MPKKLKLSETADASCLANLDLHSKVGWELKQIPHMYNGMWESGTCMICAEGFEGENKYASAVIHPGDGFEGHKAWPVASFCI
jgi:hypothetical protein